jgi:hypothetical protein
MNPFVQIAHGIVGAVAISLILILNSSFSEARHTLSLIGAVAVVIAGSYILRTRFIRWGGRQTWLKYHQRFASLGLCLVLIHSAAHPFHWHSWLTFGLALLNFATGLAVALTARGARRYLLRFHLALAPILLIAVVVHGRAQLDHDEFFPLTDAHKVHCAKCHTSEAILFTVDLYFADDLDRGESASEDLRWEFGNHDIALSEETTVSIKKSGNRWRIHDKLNQRQFEVTKDADRLSVHADTPYKAYTCLTCHAHNTPEIQSAHEIHGVFSYNACLSCHQTTIRGKPYGNRRANWEY